MEGCFYPADHVKSALTNLTSYETQPILPLSLFFMFYFSLGQFTFNKLKHKQIKSNKLTTSLWEDYSEYKVLYFYKHSQNTKTKNNTPPEIMDSSDTNRKLTDFQLTHILRNFHIFYSAFMHTRISSLMSRKFTILSLTSFNYTRNSVSQTM